jgi:uncharacterized membrane protein
MLGMRVSPISTGLVSKPAISIWLLATGYKGGFSSFAVMSIHPVCLSTTMALPDLAALLQPYLAKLQDDPQVLLVVVLALALGWLWLSRMVGHTNHTSRQINS